MLRLCFLDSNCSNLMDRTLEHPTFCWCKPRCQSIELYGVWGSVTVTIKVTLPDYDVLL